MHFCLFLLVDLWLILLILLPYLSLVVALLIVFLVLLLNFLLVCPFLLNHILPSTLPELLPHLNWLIPTLERKSFLLLKNITKNIVSPLTTHSLLRSHFNRFYLMNNPLLLIHNRHILRMNINTALLLPETFLS